MMEFVKSYILKNLGFLRLFGGWDNQPLLTRPLDVPGYKQVKDLKVETYLGSLHFTLF